MSISLILLLFITLMYAGYNLLIKVSSSYVPIESTSIIFATMTLQFAALVASCVFAAGLLIRGELSFALLPTSAISWAALAGFSIGCAEIGYFFLFRGFGDSPPMSANIAIPFIVSGTIVVTLIIAWLLFKEPLSWQKILGTILVVAGVATIYLDKKPEAIVGA